MRASKTSASGAGETLHRRGTDPACKRSEPYLWLVFAPIKRARIDYLVEKATELGASALVPVITRHTHVERLNLDRLRAHAIEAAEQSERLTVPLISQSRVLSMR